MIETQPASGRILYYHPEDLMPLWKLAALKLTELVIQILIPLGICLLAYATLPSALLLPITIGSVFSSGVLFVPRTDPVEAVPFEKIFPPPAPPVALAPNVPRGIRNGGCNCWINSLAQHLRCDRSFISWIQNTPVNLDRPEGYFWASFLPQHLLFQAEDLALHPAPSLPMIPVIKAGEINYRQFQTAGQLADRIKVTSPKQSDHLRLSDLSDEQRKTLGDKKEIPLESLTAEQVKIIRRREDVRLTDFTPEQRTAYLAQLQDRVAHWALRLPEAQALREEIVFPATGEEIVVDEKLAPGPRDEEITRVIGLSIDERYLSQFPAAERAERMHYAAKLIRELRSVAKKAELSAEEKHNLFVPIADLAVAQAAFRKYIEHRSATHLSPELVFAEQAPQELPEWFFDHFPGEDRAALTREVLAHIQQVREIVAQHPIPREIGRQMGQWIVTYQNVRNSPVERRQQLLRYINTVQSNAVHKREAVLRALLDFREFYNGYDIAIRGNLRIAAANSQSLRLAINGISDSISEHAGDQEDPAEGFTTVMQLLPPELKVKAKTRKILQGLERPEEKEVDSNGHLQVGVIGIGPTLDALIQHQFNKPASGDDPVKVNGVEYPVVREQFQFVKAPESLWIELKRYTNGTPWSFLHTFLPFWFGPSELQIEKLDTPVFMGDTLDIPTSEDGIVRYKLDSFIVHLGGSPRSGHYIEYKLALDEQGNEEWYKQDDARVTKVSPESLEKAKAQAYFLHHRKIV